jgi:hypothetical protein
MGKIATAGFTSWNTLVEDGFSLASDRGGTSVVKLDRLLPADIAGFFFCRRRPADVAKSGRGPQQSNPWPWPIKGGM